MKNLFKITAFLLSTVFFFTACSSADKSYDASPQPEAVSEGYEETAPAEAEGTFDIQLDDAQWQHIIVAEDTDEQVYGDPPQLASGKINNEKYLIIDENQENHTDENSLVTFSLKVDTASYSNIQRYISTGNIPPADAVKIEEMINYFSYDEKVSFTDDTFGIYTEVAPSILDDSKHIAFIRVKTDNIDTADLPPSNLTFLIDTSGSMASNDKLPLLKSAFSMLVETLDKDDTVSIVTYAGNSKILLDSVKGNEKHKILTAIDGLNANGSTAGGKGILHAYELAEKNFDENGNNRIILATDGDFNVGVSSIDALETLIQEKRDTGIYLSVLGFGTGNIRDDIMETLSKHGNGNYSYINSVKTAEKVLVDELQTNLFTIADDVKAQVEFNPENVKSYRLIGYENRQMANKDFNDDSKDAGEIGAGTDIVLMFEIELTDENTSMLKYKEENGTPKNEFSNELFEVRIRYKNPGEKESNLITLPVTLNQITDNPTSDFRFASSVAAFGHILRGSDYAGEETLDKVISAAKHNLGKDEKNYRYDFLNMVMEYKYMMY